MDPWNLFAASFLLLIPLYLYLTKKTSKNLPPGFLGFPIIGQTLNFALAMNRNETEEWLQERINKYGPIFKLGLFGSPTVFLHGQAANKFIFTGDGLTSVLPPTFRRITGKRNMVELQGNDHKRVRGALMTFLKPEILKKYVGKMDSEVKRHMQMYWHHDQEIKVVPLMKSLTFDIMISLIFGIEQGETRDNLIILFQDMINGLLSIIQINLPFTQFNHGVKAREKIRTMIADLIRERRSALNQQITIPQSDLISCLLSIKTEDNREVLTDEEIVDNVIGVMLAGHDASSVLLTFLIKIIGSDPQVYAHVLQEQEDIAKGKASNEGLTWDDLAKMKFTWQVAMETLRMHPPLFGTFRKAIKDVEFEGFTIPKGWNVMWVACMTQMDEQTFENPTKFDPTRFDTHNDIKQYPPYSFVAFGGGTRVCPGLEFSRIETLVTIHHLITNFTWNLSSPQNPFYRNPIPVFNNGLPIQVYSKS